MEVVSAEPSIDLSFESTTSTPYITAPSSPQAFRNFFNPSTIPPTSPPSPSHPDFDLCSREEFHEISLVPDEDKDEGSWHDNPRFSIAFAWENALPMMIHAKKEDGCVVEDDDDGKDFAFDFSRGFGESSTMSADELFHGGKIRPLKSPPLQSPAESQDGDIGGVLPATRDGGKLLEPVQISRVEDFDMPCYQQKGRERGRERNGRPSSSSSSSPSFTRKGTRSLSPLRISDILLDRDDEDLENSGLNIHKNPSSSSSSSLSSSSNYFSSLISFSKGDKKKWSFKDLLLFRSASEGRGTSKDPFRKYSSGFKRGEIAGRPVSSSSRRATESTHELHYRMKKAASEEMKRRTTLPYKHGLLGCWANGGGSRHEIASGFGSLTRGT